MRRLLLIPFLALSLTALAGAPQNGDPYVRTVQVPAAGWYRFTMDGHMWMYANERTNVFVTSGHEQDLFRDSRVNAYGPDGKPIPCGVVQRHVPSPFEESAQPELIDYSQDAAQAVLTFNIPNPAGPHRGLEFSFSKPGYMEWVTLEGSDTGKDWKFLARGKLFMVGVSASPETSGIKSDAYRLQKANLDYPPTTFTYLRLTLPIPRIEGMPQVSDLRVFYQPGKESTADEATPIALKPVEEPLASILVEPGMRARRLDLPPVTYPADGMDLPLETQHPPIRIVLWTITSGLPLKLYSCTLWPGSKTLTLPPGVLGRPLIIVTDAPTLGEVFVHERRDDIYFYASSAGTVTLTYGGIEKRSRPPIQIPSEKAAQAGPDPPQTRPLVLSSELMPLAASKPSTVAHPDQAWELNLPQGTQPGQWVQLPLSDELMKASLGNPQGFEIASGDKNVAAFLQTYAEPRLVAKEMLHLRSQPAFPNQSEAEFTWSGAHRPVSFLALASPMKPLRCTLTLSQKTPRPEKHPMGTPEPPEWTAVDRKEWSCGPWDSTCGILIPLQVSGIDRMQIILDGGQSPGPDTLEASLWQRRYRLVFPVPSSGAARLTWSKNRWPAPGRLAEYVLPELLPEMLPEVSAGTGTAARIPDKRWETILFYGALILAALVLLFLIARLLPKRER